VVLQRPPAETEALARNLACVEAHASLVFRDERRAASRRCAVPDVRTGSISHGVRDDGEGGAGVQAEPEDPAKIEAVRFRLLSMFSAAAVDVVEASDGRPVEFSSKPLGLPRRHAHISRAAPSATRPSRVGGRGETPSPSGRRVAHRPRRKRGRPPNWATRGRPRNRRRRSRSAPTPPRGTRVPGSGGSRPRRHGLCSLALTGATNLIVRIARDPRVPPGILHASLGGVA
jgi:hypothetical protein